VPSSSSVTAPSMMATPSGNAFLLVHPGVKPIMGSTATLGPAGTSSQAAARYLTPAQGADTETPIRLYSTYEAARDAVLTGEATRLLVANAYSGIDEFYMDLRLELEQAFIFDTPLYGLATRPSVPLPLLCRITTHPAPRSLIRQLIPPGYGVADIQFATSTSAAAEEAATGEADIALTTVPAASLHGLRFISATRPIRMLWSTFIRSTGQASLLSSVGS
jgi:prephenate dehydratase